MKVVTDVLVNGAWLTQAPTYHGQPVRVTTYFDNGTFGVVETQFGGGSADMRITKLAFKQRFTQAERIAIREAAQTVPEVYDFEDLVNSASFIDLARPDTIAAVHYIEAGGLIAEGRAVEILSPPVTEIEQYRGDL
jgi:hypothetical protein